MALTRTIPLLMLLHELDRLKASSKVSSERAAEELGCRVSKISRIHLGQSKISPGDTKLLADLYGAGPELAAVLVDLARTLARPGEAPEYRAAYRDSFTLLFDMERNADSIRYVQSEIVPGLLQTEGYVRALYEAPTPFPRPVDIEKAVAGSRGRQAVLDRAEDAPTFSAVLSESVLRRRYGSDAVMREQLNHLITLSQQPGFQIQVLPFANSATVTHTSINFALFHIPGRGVATPLDFVYVEQYDEARYLDSDERVSGYQQLWGYLESAALDEEKSRAFMTDVAAEYGPRKETEDYMPAEAFDGAVWRKATASEPQQGCVEFARVGDVVGVRDSKVPGGPVLQFSTAEIHAMLDGAREGEFDYLAD
jgi:hypothetical protein